MAAPAASDLADWLPLVRMVAHETVRGHPWLEFDDTAQELAAALPALVAAYDPALAPGDNGDPFRSYLVQRLRWRAQDHARRESPFRQYRPAITGGDSGELRRGGISLSLLLEEGTDVAAAPDPDPAERVAVRAAVAALPGRSRDILFRRFYQDVGPSEVAAHLGISRARVEQLTRRALDQLEHVLAGPTRTAATTPPARRPSRLSSRELDVLALAAGGCSNREIADALGVALETVKTHRKHVIAKLEARNTVHAVHLAHQRGLLR